MELLSDSTGLWKIYQDFRDGHALIFRKPNGSARTRMDDFLCNYEIIKGLNLPTLKCLKEKQENGETYLVTEDINYGQSRIYVSANSVYTNERNQVELLTQAILKLKPTSKVMSPYERYRYENKLYQIIELESFLTKMKAVLTHISARGVYIEFDAYFFGTDKGQCSSIDYKIVDLDSIYREDPSSSLHNKNVSEFIKALHEFIENFVVPESKGEYQRHVSTLLC